jgi:hypothetical protein
VTWPTLLAAAVLAALLLPATAWAHGRSAPAATDWRARIANVPDGLHAIAVDGDQDLWLRVPKERTVEVLGTLGEPMLRFDAQGVWGNHASPTAQADRVVRSAGHGWQRLASGHAYRWHEHRLHLRELTSGGPWSVPLRIDGGRAAIRGGLLRLPPGRRWPWALAGVVLLATGLAFRPLRLAAFAAAASAAAIRVGHAVHGRPFVGAAGYADAVSTALLAALLLTGALAARSLEGRATAALAIGVAALSEAVVMTPVLTRAVALNELGTPLSRALVVLSFAAGAVALVVGFGTLIKKESQ